MMVPIRKLWLDRVTIIAKIRGSERCVLLSSAEMLRQKCKDDVKPQQGSFDFGE